MFDFFLVEAALARIHQIPAEGRSAFRARLQNLRRVGAARSSSGRGKRLTYTKADAWLIAFCVELAQFGTDPTAIARLTDANKARILDYFKQAEADPRVQCYVVFTPAFMAPTDEGDNFRLVKIFPNDKKMPRENFIEWLGRRAAIVNITALQQEFAGAIAALTATEEQAA